MLSSFSLSQVCSKQPSCAGVIKCPSYFDFKSPVSFVNVSGGITVAIVIYMWSTTLETNGMFNGDSGWEKEWGGVC